MGEPIRLALAEQWKSLTSLDLEDCTFSIDQQQLEDVRTYFRALFGQRRKEEGREEEGRGKELQIFLILQKKRKKKDPITTPFVEK